MPGFILDTSGTVHTVPGAPAGQGTHHPVDLDWCDLDPVTRACIEALFFTEEESLKDQAKGTFAGTFVGETLLDADALGFSSLAPATLARIIKDCRDFQASPAYVAAKAAWNDTTADEGRLAGFPLDEETRAGHDFWMTRNGHGAGFWDGDWPEPHASALDDAAKAFGETETYLGDDCRVYLS